MLTLNDLKTIGNTIYYLSDDGMGNDIICSFIILAKATDNDRYDSFIKFGELFPYWCDVEYLEGVNGYYNNYKDAKKELLERKICKL